MWGLPSKRQKCEVTYSFEYPQRGPEFINGDLWIRSVNKQKAEMYLFTDGSWDFLAEFKHA